MSPEGAIIGPARRLWRRYEKNSAPQRIKPKTKIPSRSRKPQNTIITYICTLN